ncbi:uncharacterized protein [Amphiura filiformis]|uniref:uncharacterized protein n=1 Tax=Amphiura filiformis TaxID=82378 RepID=UPI003B21B340
MDRTSTTYTKVSLVLNMEMLTVLSVLLCVVYGQDMIITSPENATYVLYEKAQFTCTVDETYFAMRRNLHWIKGYDTFLSPYEDPNKYSMMNDGNIFILEIFDLTLEDEANYKCAVHIDSLTGYELSNPAFLKVLTKWPRPNCATNPVSAAVDDLVTFSCALSPSTAIALPLTWSTADSATFGGTEIVLPGNTYSVTWKVREIDNYMNFMCYVGREDGHGNACTKTPLKIRPMPDVQPKTMEKIVGETAIFDCELNIMYPIVTQYTWVIKDKGVATEYTSSSGRYRVKEKGAVFKVKNLTMHDNNLQVLCKTQHEFGIDAEANETGIVYMYEELIEQPKVDDNNSLGAIIGGTVAGVILLVIIVLLVMYLIMGKDLTHLINKKGKDADGHEAAATATDKSDDNHTTPDTDAVLYALPLQKGGGTIEVKPFEAKNDSSVESSPTVQDSKKIKNVMKTRNATLPSKLRDKIATNIDQKSPLMPTKSLSSLNSLGNKSDYVLYSLPLQKGGGQIKVRSRNVSLENLDKMSQNSGSTFAMNSGAPECKDASNGDISRADASEYADISNGDISQADASEYADISNGDISRADASEYADISNYECTVEVNQTPKLIVVDEAIVTSDPANNEEYVYEDVNITEDNVDRETGIVANLNSEYADVTITHNKSAEEAPSLKVNSNIDSPYVYMSGKKKEKRKTSDAHYVLADFPSFRSESMDSLITENTDDPRNLNVEGITYARVDTKKEGNVDKIVADQNGTEYAAITNVL